MQWWRENVLDGFLDTGCQNDPDGIDAMMAKPLLPLRIDDF
jgi:hypothetical protein